MVFWTFFLKSKNKFEAALWGVKVVALRANGVPGTAVGDGGFKWAHLVRPGDAHGRAPLFRPVITFLPSRHRNKVDRFINRRGIIGLVGFAITHSLIRAPLDRFRVGLMTEIPARENSSKTQKPQKLLQSLWYQEKSCLEGPVSLIDFLPEVRKLF